MKEERLNEISSLEKYCEDKTPVEIIVDEIITFTSQDENKTKRYGVKGYFIFNNHKKIVLIRPENLLRKYNEESVQELLNTEISVCLTKVKTYNKLFTIKIKHKKNTSKKYHFNKENEKNIIKNFDKYVDKEVEAEIYRFTDFGAYLVDNNNVRYFLYDSGFALGYINIRRVKKNWR